MQTLAACQFAWACLVLLALSCLFSGVLVAWATRKARSIVREAERRGKDAELRGEDRARRLVKTALQVAIRLGDKRVVVVKPPRA